MVARRGHARRCAPVSRAPSSPRRARRWLPPQEAYAADEARSRTPDDGLDAVAQLQLASRLATCVLTVASLDDEPLGDLGVGQAAGDAAAAPRARVRSARRARAARSAGGATKLLDQPARDRRARAAPRRGDDADRRDQLLRRRVLEEEAAGAGAQRVVRRTRRGRTWSGSAPGRRCPAARIRRVASMPSSAGMRMSIRITSGWSSAAQLRPPPRRLLPRPPPRCPVRRRGSARKPARTSAWSSTMQRGSRRSLETECVRARGSRRRPRGPARARRRTVRRARACRPGRGRSPAVALPPTPSSAISSSTASPAVADADARPGGAGVLTCSSAPPGRCGRRRGRGGGSARGLPFDTRRPPGRPGGSDRRAGRGRPRPGWGRARALLVAAEHTEQRRISSSASRPVSAIAARRRGRRGCVA